jgi:DNA repair exonuclease SbcCD ATPase subunit
MLVNSIDIFRQLPPDPEITYTKKNYDELLSTRENKHNLYIKTSTTLEDLSRQLTENNSTKEVICPNCSHSFIPNDRSTHIKEHIKELQAVLANLTIELKSIEESRQKYSDYLSNYEQILRLYKSSKDYLGVFWSTINLNNTLRKDPLQVVTMVKDLSSEVDYLQQVKQLQQEVNKLQVDLDILSRNKDKSYKDIDTKIHSIQEELITLNQVKKEVLNDLQQIDLVSKIYNANNTIQVNITKAINTIRESNLSTATYNLITSIEEEIRNYRLQLVKLDESILSYKSGQEVISKIQENIDSEMNHVTVLEYLLNELSPKDGLIAKSISSFLNIIVGNINSIVKSVWNYSMELIPIDVDKDNLDYKFKLQVNSVSNADDISKASSGMREIIDLSFRLTLYRLLNLQGYSVYLDEFGIRLDTSHRAKIADMIFKLMNSQVYSQVFLITHMDLQYAQYKDVEVIEL